jgi:hypothetical protein
MNHFFIQPNLANQKAKTSTRICEKTKQWTTSAQNVNATTVEQSVRGGQMPTTIGAGFASV